MKYLVLALLLIGQVAYSQDESTENFFKSTFTVQGTSNDHAWELSSEVADLNVIVYSEKEVINVEKFTGKVPVAELKNDNPLMTQDAYQALKGYEFPFITFRLTEVISQSNHSGDIVGKVEIKIAGEVSILDFLVKTQLLNDGLVRISGWKGVKMTDFGVQPPQFFNGAIQAYDDIVIRFEMNVPLTEKKAKK
jgi:polyisoprenoid-binding protein YceI